MFPSNFYNLHDSSTNGRNVVENVPNQTNNGFEFYNVQPSYWAERERQLFNTETSTVSAQSIPLPSRTNFGFVNEEPNIYWNNSPYPVQAIPSSSSGGFSLFNANPDFQVQKFPAEFYNSAWKDGNSLKKRAGRPPGRKNSVKDVIQKEKKPRKPRAINLNKSIFRNTHFITLALLNSKDEMCTAGEIYKFVEYHFSYISTIAHWRNTVRNALSVNHGFQRVQVDDSRPKRASPWQFVPEKREELIRSLNQTVIQNENNMETFRLRNTDDLSALLRGNCPVPSDFLAENDDLNVSSQLNNSCSTNNESFQNSSFGDVLSQKDTSSSNFNESFQNSSFGDYLPKDWLDLGPSTSADLNSNIQQSAEAQNSYLDVEAIPCSQGFPVVYNMPRVLPVNQKIGLHGNFFIKQNTVPSSLTIKENNENTKPAEF